MLTLTVDIDPSALIAALGRLPKALNVRRLPMRTAFSTASDTLMRWEEGRFVAASGLDGTWADIKPVTKLRRLQRQAKAVNANKSRGELARVAASAVMPVLYETGALQAGLFTRGATGHFLEFDDDSVTEGVRGGTHPNAPISVGELAFAHHYGVPSRNLPARPVMGEPDAKCLADMGEDIFDGARQAFAQLANQVSGGMSAA